MRSNAKSGSVNESMILLALNNHHFKDLSDKWKRHMKRMFKDIKDDDLIKASYYEIKNAKPDLVIEVNTRKILLSVKSGHAPTMHQEPIKTFFDFLRGLDVPESIIKIIAFYHYGYFLNEHRGILTREQIVQYYPEKIKEVNDYFNNNEDIVRELIYRSIIRGRVKGDLIDYFYYGNSARGFLLSVGDIVKLITNEENKYYETLTFKSLTYVAYTRDRDNPKRHNMKINWPILCKYFYDNAFMKKYG